MPPQAHELGQRVRRAAEGTPYAVTETDRGFDVALDIVDARWFGLFNRAGVRKHHVHHVTVPEAGVYTITDDVRDVEWVAGAPRIAGSVQRSMGRIKEVGFSKVWAFDEHGDFGVQADYRFDSEEGRDLITGVADQLGMRQERGTAEKVGLYVGVGTLVLLAIGGIVVGILALAGAFG